jgi:hypothetical protein
MLLMMPVLLKLKQWRTDIMTPLAVDQFSRFMVEMFDEKQIIGVPSVWQSFFGRPEHGSKTVFNPNSKVVEIDIMRGNERIAALIQRGTNSRHVGNLQRNTDTQNYSSFSRVYPLGEEMGDITADQILSRVAGENPYENRNRLDRMRTLAREHHLEHIRRYVRLFEILAGSSLLTGQMPGILGTNNSDLIFDFRRNAAHIITVANAWNGAAADIMGDVDGGCELIRQNGHTTPNVLLLGGDAMDAFIKDTTVQSLADNRRFELIEVSTNNPVPPALAQLVASGAIPRGRLRTPKGYELWLFTYIDVYTDGNGDPQKYLPEDTAFLAFYGARCDRYFGPPELLPIDSAKAAWYQEIFGFNMMAPPMPPNIKNLGSVVNPAMFYSDAYKAKDDKKITVRTQSAPIYATTMTDAFVTLNGLVESDDS